MNRIQQKVSGDKKILSIYFTAGYPSLGDTATIIEHLELSGVDMIEIGMPFSDPLADGETIQESSTTALKNGMSTEVLFRQLSDIRLKIKIPLIIMGYLNPIIQYGVKDFCKTCAEIGIDGLIIPDLPIGLYHRNYQTIFESYGIENIFLITPQTNDKRIQFIDSISNSFIYLVSSASTTGSKESFDQPTLDYFERIAAMELKNPTVVGFGIGNHKTFLQATSHAQGAIIGSSFIHHIKSYGISLDNISRFTRKIRNA